MRGCNTTMLDAGVLGDPVFRVNWAAAQGAGGAGQRHPCSLGFLAVGFPTAATRASRTSRTARIPSPVRVAVVNYRSRVCLAACARSTSSRWSRRYQRRPLYATLGIRPRRARAFTATRLTPITSAASAEVNQSWSLSGGCGPTGSFRRRAAAWAARRAFRYATTSARFRTGLWSRFLRSPRRIILGTADMCTSRICAASRTVIHSDMTGTVTSDRFSAHPPDRGRTT